MHWWHKGVRLESRNSSDEMDILGSLKLWKIQINPLYSEDLDKNVNIIYPVLSWLMAYLVIVPVNVS